MKYSLKIIYLGMFMIFSGFQCSRWSEYSEDISLDITPDKIISINDSVNFLMEASMLQDNLKKIDSVELDFYYLPENNFLVKNNESIGAIFLTEKMPSQIKTFKIKFVEGRSLYVKQVVKKNKKKIESPLLILVEQ